MYRKEGRLRIVFTRYNQLVFSDLADGNEGVVCCAPFNGLNWVVLFSDVSNFIIKALLTV